MHISDLFFDAFSMEAIMTYSDAVRIWKNSLEKEKNPVDIPSVQTYNETAVETDGTFLMQKPLAPVEALT